MSISISWSMSCFWAYQAPAIVHRWNAWRSQVQNADRCYRCDESSGGSTCRKQ